MGQLELLRARRFGPFFWTQFLGALNDNLFKNALVILFAFRMGGVVFSENTLVNLSTGLLTLPFFLFSASAGQIADKFDKSRIIRLVKLFEIGIMLLGAAGLHLHSVPLLLGVVFLMGTHSAVFGPVKYSILPQHLHADELVGGNALVQMGTFAAILLGTILGVALGCMSCGRLSNRTVELGLGPFGSIGLSLFALDLFFATRGLVPAGTPLGVLALLGRLHHWRVLADLVLIGAFGGFFIVPLQALVQQRSEPRRRSRIIAANNILNALFMVLAAVLGIVLRDAGLTIPELILVTAVVNAAVAVYIYTLIPEFLMRFLVWLLVHTIYRMRTHGMENLPEEGAAVLVSNHVSFVDALVIAAACRRPIRFVMDHSYFRMPVLNFFCRTVRAIPIASRKEDPKVVERAFDAVADALEEGSLVCIFPEGRLTANGDLGLLRPGIERVLARTPVPGVPLALRGLWGSFFSRKDGRAMSRPFRRVWSRIECVCGEPVPAAQVTAAALQERVAALRGDRR